MARIMFNTLLREECITPADVKLVRHQGNIKGLTPYKLWSANDGRFELYQRIQRRDVFEGAQVLASFVATPFNETLFVGLYRINGVGKAEPGTPDPLSGDDIGGRNLYDLEPAQELAYYRGRLLVEWGEGYRAWVQRGQKQDKEVVELRPTIGEKLSSLAAVPRSWREVLSAVGGVYLLTCPRTGKQYVGSASGAEGFWGRWEAYVASGHGGNRRMREIPAADYQVTVLEVAASSTTIDALIAMEAKWKQKLLSREFGLNAN